MFLELEEEFIKELLLDRTLLLLTVWLINKSFQHSNTLILAKGAHLRHLIDGFKQKLRGVTESNHAGSNHTDVLIHVLVKLLNDLLFDLSELLLVRFDTINWDVCGALREHING